MKKIKKFIKNNIKVLVAFIIGLLIAGSGVYAATILFNSNEVKYNNTTSKLASTNVQDAIDELYNKCNTNFTCSGSSCPKCVRATKLHTETCSQTDATYYCSSAGYTTSGSKGTTMISYGKAKVLGSTLETGDAFDCDVNKDGIYDSKTERFYYVSDLWNKPINGSDTYNTNTAVLIYYTNFKDGSPSTNGAAYNSNARNFEGPVTGVTHLPSTSLWSNVSLTNTSRQIYTETGTTSTFGGSLPIFSYTGKSGRLITYQEVKEGCPNMSTTTGSLDDCNFLFENTYYSSSSLPTLGPWFESSYVSSASSVWGSNGSNRRANSDIASGTYHGVRPAIEVAKSNILY